MRRTQHSDTLNRAHPSRVDRTGSKGRTQSGDPQSHRLSQRPARCVARDRRSGVDCGRAPERNGRRHMQKRSTDRPLEERPALRRVRRSLQRRRVLHGPRGPRGPLAEPHGRGQRFPAGADPARSGARAQAAGEPARGAEGPSIRREAARALRRVVRRHPDRPYRRGDRRSREWAAGGSADPHTARTYRPAGESAMKARPVVETNRDDTRSRRP